MEINCEINFFARDIFSVYKYHEQLVWKDNDQHCLNYIKFIREPEIFIKPRSLHQVALDLKENRNVEILIIDNEFKLDEIKAKQRTKNIYGNLLSVVKNSEINELFLILKNDFVKKCVLKKLTRLTLMQDNSREDIYNHALRLSKHIRKHSKH